MTRSQNHCTPQYCQDIGNRCAAFNLRRASRAISQLYGQLMQDTGLKSTQFSLLNAVVAMGHPSVNELSEALGMDRTTLTRNLKPLLQAGYLQDEAGQDRRARIISITRFGKRTLEDSMSRWQQAQQLIEQRYGKQRLQRLIADLRELTEVANE